MTYRLEPVEGNPFETGSSYRLEPVDNDPFAAPKKDTSWLKAVAYGLRQGQQEAAKAADATGIPRPKRNMADALAEQAGLDMYDPAGPHVADSNASFGERASYLPRAMVEGIGPSLTRLGAATVGGLPGLLGYSAAVNAPQAVEMVTKGNQGQGISPEQMARAAALTLANTGMDAVGTGALMRPAKTALGGVGKAALGGAVDSAVSDAANRGIGRGESSTLSDLALAGVAGAGTSAAMRAGLTPGKTATEAAGAAKAVVDAPEASRFRQFEAEDPIRVAEAAKLLNDKTAPYKKIKESNAEDVLNRARAITKASMDFEAKDRFQRHEDLIKTEVDNLRTQGRTDVAQAYVDAIAATNKGEPASKADRELLRATLGGDEIRDRWLNALDRSTIINQLGDMGAKVGQKGRAGGIHATPAGQTLDRVSKYFGTGLLGGSVGLSALGLPHIGNVGLGIGVGSNLLNAGVRGVDVLSGYSNPVGRFARRYSGGAPKQISPRSAPITPPAPPQAGPNVPPTTPKDLFMKDLGFAPGEAPSPSEMALVGKILKKLGNPNMGPKSGESLTTVPARKLPHGADEAFRAPPADAAASPENLAKIDALTKRISQQASQVEPSEAFKLAKAAAMAKKAERDRLKGKIEPRPKSEEAPAPQELFPEPPKPTEPEVSGSSPVDRELLRMNLALSKMTGKAADAPKQTRAPKAAPAPEQAAGEAPSDLFTTNVFGRDVSIPTSEIRRSPEAWAAGVARDAGTRKVVIDRIKEVVPKDLHNDVEDLFTKWLSPGVKKESAYYALEDFVNDPRVPDGVRGQLLDIWINAKDLQDESHWR